MLISILLLVTSFTVILYFIVYYLERKVVGESSGSDEIPFVSIVIAVRNEGQNIPVLFESLKNLNYPTDSFEILLGNDHSSDNSLELLNNNELKNSRVFNVNHKVGGKLEVLKELTQYASGEFLLFTDADVILNPDWIDGMISKSSEKLKLRLGVTLISGDQWFHEVQNIDWLVNQSLISFLTKYIHPVTAWGNNMSIERNQFERLGAFSGIEKTIVEDVELMRKVVLNEGHIEIKANPQTLIKTRPCNSWIALLHQRLRWFKGVEKLSLYIKIGLIFKTIFLPCIIMLCIIDPWFLFVIPAKSLLNYLIVNLLSKKLKQSVRWQPFIVFDFYEFAINFLTFVMYLLPLQVNWKGRKY
ncbi:MAG: glycosyltransferase [Reichenbachiella sp.]